MEARQPAAASRSQPASRPAGQVPGGVRARACRPGIWRALAQAGQGVRRPPPRPDLSTQRWVSPRVMESPTTTWITSGRLDKRLKPTLPPSVSARHRQDVAHGVMSRSGSLREGGRRAARACSARGAPELRFVPGLSRLISNPGLGDSRWTALIERIRTSCPLRGTSRLTQTINGPEICRLREGRAGTCSTSAPGRTPRPARCEEPPFEYLREINAAPRHGATRPGGHPMHYAVSGTGTVRAAVVEPVREDDVGCCVTRPQGPIRARGASPNRPPPCRPRDPRLPPDRRATGLATQRAAVAPSRSARSPPTLVRRHRSPRSRE